MQRPRLSLIWSRWFTAVKASIAILAVALLGPFGCATKTVEETADVSAGKSPKRQTDHKQKPKAVPKKPPLEQRVYGGRQFAEWPEFFKNIDPKGPDGTAAVDGLIALMQDEDAPMSMRRRAAVTLGRIGRRAEKSVPLFIGYLRTMRDSKKPADRDVSRFSLKALTMLGRVAHTATDELIKMVQDLNQPVLQRAAAMEALARIGSANAKAVQTVVSMLTYRGGFGVSLRDRWFLQRFAADAVGIIGPDAYVIAIPKLRISMRRRDDDELRRRCALALGAMGNKGRDGISVLIYALTRDDSPGVRDAAVEALAMLGEKKGGLASLVVPELQKLMNVDDEVAKSRAALSLGKIGPPANGAIDDLDYALDDEDGWVRINSAEAIWKITGDVSRAAPAMVEELKHPNRQIRIKAYRFFKTVGPKASSSIAGLTRLLQHKNGKVRLAAAKALQAVRRKR